MPKSFRQKYISATNLSTLTMSLPSLPFDPLPAENWSAKMPVTKWAGEDSIGAEDGEGLYEALSQFPAISGHCVRARSGKTTRKGIPVDYRKE